MANDRIYQAPAEVVVKPDTQKAQVTHLPVESVIAPTSQKARVSQLVVEAVYPSSNPTTPVATGYAFGYILG